ncbi:hypothetical protein YC2023_079104 [Brassica napus]
MKPCRSSSHPISYLLSILLTLYAIIIGITTPKLPRFYFSSVVKIMISQCWTTSYDLLLLLKLLYLLLFFSKDGYTKANVCTCLAYIKTVKDKFKDTRQKFDEFLEVIADFRAEKYSFLFLVSIHSCHKITIGVDQTPPKEPVTFEEAVIFVRNVKARFQDNDRPYRSFLDSLNMYRNNNRSRTEVLEEIFDERKYRQMKTIDKKDNRKTSFNKERFGVILK